jgi:glycerol-3-phosphate acyltransferase PlsY
MTMPDGTMTTAGWVIFVAAIGMMLGMLAVDIASLKAWSDMQTPVFVGTTLGHMAAVIAAFVGGKIIPAVRNGQLTRSNDPKP